MNITIPLSTLERLMQERGLTPEQMAGIKRDLDLWQEAQQSKESATPEPITVPTILPYQPPYKPYRREPWETPMWEWQPGKAPTYQPLRVSCGSTTAEPLPQPEYRFNS